MADGKQYIVLATNDGKLVALSLPDDVKSRSPQTIAPDDRIHSMRDREMSVRYVDC